MPVDFSQEVLPCSSLDPLPRQRIGQLCCVERFFLSSAAEKFLRSPLLWPDSHQLNYSFSRADSWSFSLPSGAKSVESVLPDASHICLAWRHSVAYWRARSHAIVFLTASPTPCHPIVLRKPSACSPADGPSAPARLILSAT